MGSITHKTQKERMCLGLNIKHKKSFIWNIRHKQVNMLRESAELR